MSQVKRIGLFGFGNVGQGLYEILESPNAVKTEVVHICCKHPEKRRSLPMERFTFDRNDILSDDSLDLIVEAIDDAQAAYEIVKAALSKGMSVVTANKKMVAEHMEELIVLQKENRAALLYEASACSSIPILRTLEEYYDNDLLDSVYGIFNGSSNYILTKLFEKNLDYDWALKQAQDLGFAESNPSLDVQGFDALYKLCIIATHAFGVFPDPKQVVHAGIGYIAPEDIQYAREKEVKIKQVARVQRVGEREVALFVLPEFVPKTHPLYNIEEEINGVIVEAEFCGQQLMSGKGAGSHPTGFAMVSDISACGYDYKYEYKKHLQKLGLQITLDFTIPVYLRAFDPRNIDALKFERIEARFEGQGHHYVLGEISLKELQCQQKHLESADILLVHRPAAESAIEGTRSRSVL